VAALARCLFASLQGMSVEARDGATERELLDLVPLISEQIRQYRCLKKGAARAMT
jgi:hypothetical protein